MDKLGKRGPADRDFAFAAKFARRGIREDGLAGALGADGQYRYTVSQGLKAACHGREDAAATLVAQRLTLVRLVRVERLLWVGLALLTILVLRH
jgi:hypothetical protein